MASIFTQSVSELKLPSSQECHSALSDNFPRKAYLPAKFRERYLEKQNLEELLLRAKFEPQAMDQLLKYLHPQVLKFLRQKVVNLEVAEDLSQEALVRIFNSFKDFRAIECAKFSAWWHMIAKNVFLDWLRSCNKDLLKRSVSLEEYCEDLTTNRSESEIFKDPAETYATKESFNTLIRNLPAFRRQAFTLLSEGFTYPEIADELNVPIGTVRSSIHRGRMFLEPLLKSIPNPTK